MIYYRNVIVFIFIFLLEGCGSVIQSDWETAKGLNTAPAYQEFLNKHPRSAFSAKAKKIIQKESEKKAWENAQQLNTLKSYKTYLKKYSRGKHHKTAKRNISKLAWVKVLKKNSIGAYLTYSRRYPDSVNASKAKDRIKSRIASASPISKRELRVIKKEIARIILPFKLSDLYDKSMITPIKGMVTLNTIEQTIKGGGTLLRVKLQARPNAGTIDLFHFNSVPPKTEHLMRIRDLRYTQSNKLVFSEVELKNYKGLGKIAHFICRNHKCYDYRSLKRLKK